ncbi:MAG: hypothetical protein QM703_26490 [Gemmatales bacterium]
MDQLVGSNCIGCHQPISKSRRAETCMCCGNPIHTSCKRSIKKDEHLGACYGCGHYARDGFEATPQAIPQKALKDSTALILVGLIISILGVALFIGSAMGTLQLSSFVGVLVLMIGGAVVGMGKRV